MLILLYSNIAYKRVAVSMDQFKETIWYDYT